MVVVIMYTDILICAFNHNDVGLLRTIKDLIVKTAPIVIDLLYRMRVNGYILNEVNKQKSLTSIDRFLEWDK